MTFELVVSNIKRIALLIDKFDDKAIEFINAVLPFMPEKFKSVVDYILKYEPKVVLFVLNIVEAIERLGGNGETKLNEAIKVTQNAPSELAVKHSENFGGMINEAVSLVNSFLK